MERRTVARILTYSIVACATFLGTRQLYLPAKGQKSQLVKGTETDSRGCIYEGQFYNGEPYGQGKMTNPDSSICEGEFRNGLIHGKGVCHYSDGDFYEGEFRNGVFHGHGTYHKSTGAWAEGEFTNGLANGKFTIHSISRGCDFDTVFVNTEVW